MKQSLFELIERFQEARIAVIGDMTLDMYVYGSPRRLSREAPVVVVQYEGEETMPGGAANVVNNLCRLGARVFPIGVLGDDGPGHTLVAAFSGNSVERDGFILEAGRATVTKTRFLAGDTHTSKQQVFRLDRDISRPLDAETEERVIALLDRAGNWADVIIVSDYGYDVLTPSVRSKLTEMAADKTLLIDSRYRLGAFHGATMVKPNESEARAATGITGQSDDDMYEAGRRLLGMLSCRALALTRGNKGMIVFEQHKDPTTVPICDTSNVTGITDVSGAGDTVASLLGLGLACGASYVEAAQLATYAAAVVVTKRGVATASVEELKLTVEADLGKES